MRFILGFICYGILFYLIYLFFPDAFFTLVSWANSATELLKDFYSQLAGKVQEWRRGGEGQSAQHALLFLGMWLKLFRF